MSPKLNQHQILESGHKRGHKLSTRSSAVVQETMPNWSGSSGADFFWSHMPKNSRWWRTQLSCSWLIMREWHAVHEGNNQNVYSGSECCKANSQMRQHASISWKLNKLFLFNVSVRVFLNYFIFVPYSVCSHLIIINTH